MQHDKFLFQSRTNLEKLFGAHGHVQVRSS